MSLSELVGCCMEFPELLNVDHDKISMYISLLRHLKPQISFTQSSTCTNAPQGLPAAFHQFIQLALDFDDWTARTCWTALKNLAWKSDDVAPRDLTALVPMFLTHGAPLDIAIYDLLPPVRTCIVADCPNNPMQRHDDSTPPDLREQVRHQAVLYTRTYGALPIYTSSTYCRGCNTRYHPDCFVRSNTRTYYDTDITPASPVFQLSTHFFFERELCERFANQMAMAWTSAQNCARIYNDEARARAWTTELPQDWSITYDLDPESVSEAFVIHALLDWHRNNGTTLQVQHKAPNQATRWHDAVHARNLALAGTGQPAWNHACNRCTRHIMDEHGKLIGAYRSVVTDGVSVGRPCCAVHDCKEPLANSKQRWCPQHEGMQGKCAVVACDSPAAPSYRTCDIANHRATEERYTERGRAMFQLKQRLGKKVFEAPVEDAAATTVEDAAATTLQEGDLSRAAEDDDEVLLDETGNFVDVCDDKPDEGHRKVFARFGRRRTHNEQLCVASCGVILGRATFYGAEGPNSVRIFLKCLFPTQASLPSVIWYDNNCRLAAMLAADNDSYFDRVALPVDVFHFKSKHKESDEFCGRYCNPARWVELIDDETGEWAFNSSASEQCNGWFGGSRAITRLMRADRYTFLLDEAITRRNAHIVTKLHAAGEAPYSIPREALLRVD